MGTEERLSILSMLAEGKISVDEAERLLQHADTALYQAKEEGRHFDLLEKEYDRFIAQEG